MDGKVLYWTGALLNMAALVGLALNGVRRVRSGDVAGHRRSMLAAASLVGLFVASYALKLALLGREDLERWSGSSLAILRFHELCVLVMLVGGGLALARGHALRRTRGLGAGDEAEPASPLQLARHRRAGRIALGAALAGLVSAACVLAGMYARA